jgi:hypothetical protein
LCFLAGCVEPFEGSHVEILLGGATHVPGDQNPGSGRPPSDTHYEMWVSSGGIAFHIFDFEVVPVVDLTHPCFIEDDDSRYPGLHSSMIAEKVYEDITANGEVTQEEAGRLADAEVRASNQEVLAAELKTVASHPLEVRLPSGSVVPSRDLRTMLEAIVPARTDISDAANTARAVACKDFFAQNPDYYVGNDKVFSLPLNGEFYGMVDGTDPRNSAFVGGAGFDVPQTFREFDSLMINWQFNDPADPRIAVYGDAAIGYHYMAGAPEDRTRRVITVPLRSVDFPQLSGTVAVYPGIDDDEVQF